MKDKYLAVKISFPESDFAGATIYLEDWQAGAESPGGRK